MDIFFKGEESARFARFAKVINSLFEAETVRVSLTGREPLTSKYINVKGRVKGAMHNGYRRHVEIIEDDTNKIYWAAGTNATSSVATSNIIFSLTNEQYDLLIEKGKEKRIYIPTLSKELGLGKDWVFIDDSIENIDEKNAKHLLLIVCGNQYSWDLRLEAALCLRSYANFMSRNIRIRGDCETKISKVLQQSLDDNNVPDDFRIAVAELIGYVGTRRSESILKNTIIRTNSIHVKWASVIALGRIDSDTVISFFKDELKKMMNDDDIEANDRASVSDSAWVEAALLLCISRRVYEIADALEQSEYEHIFVYYLNHNNQVLQRYACLGLTQIGRLTMETIDLLIKKLNNAKQIVDSGYYAMALLPTFKYPHLSHVWTDERVNSIKSVLHLLVAHTLESDSEPDDIWSMENLADLSLEVEDNKLARLFHQNLANVFSDWRYEYYESLSKYEEAEISISEKRPHDFVRSRFSNAIKSLKIIVEDDDYSKSIINFRTAIIQARFQLFEVLYSWKTAKDAEELSNLSNILTRDVIQIYQQYLFDNDNQGVSKREIECLRETFEIVKILDMILRLHCRLLSCLNTNEEIQHQLSNISISITRIIESNSVSMGQNRTLSNLQELINNITKEINDSGDFENVLRLMNDISLFANTISWTMPAHMCLLTGLGKGSISVVNEKIEGTGTNRDPFVLQASDSQVFLSIQLEVSTGASIATSVICNWPDNQRQQLNIVEGVALCSFPIPQTVLKGANKFTMVFTLEFSTNDIIQKTDFSYFFRRKVS